MKKITATIALACAALSFSNNIFAQDAMKKMKPPVAKKEPKVTKIHGYELIDDYAWLRSSKDPKTNEVRPEVKQYLTEENAYTEAAMSETKDFQKALYDEMLAKIKQTDISLPSKNGKYWYYSKTQEGKQYPTYFRALNDKAKGEEVLLDQNEMAKGYQYYAIGEFDVSDNDQILAFSTDTNGYRQYTLQFKDLMTGKVLPDKIERVTSMAWTADNKTVYVVQEDAVTKRSDKLWRYVIGSNKPELVYEEKDVLYNIGVSRSRDRKMLFVGAYAKTMTEWRYLAADNPTGEWKIVLPREENHEYAVDYYDGKFFITTNKNATNFRVVSAPVGDASEKNWTEFIAHNPKIKVENIEFFKGYGVVYERENGLENLRVIDMKSNKSTRIPTPESVYSISMSGNAEFDTKTVRFNYTSMVTPASVYEYNLKSGATKLLKQQEVLGGFDKNKYETQRVWATARDGVKVPVSLLMKKGTVLDGKAPMLLYAYGSYGISMTPSFTSTRLSLVDRGMIYAIAHIRGGSELGEEWRQSGRMFKKITTFEDFVDTADYLVKNKYTSSDRLVIQGGSAGGLLMGAVSNMRPDLFKAVIAQVPFVDVMNTMLDETLPLTTEEWIEWGNPNEKQAFDYMIRYSPYENVKAQAYPNMLIEVSLNDSQVPYWEGAKLAAKIREKKTNDAEILLKTNMGAGHGGSSGRYDRLKEVAFDYAYALKQVGITK